MQLKIVLALDGMSTCNKWRLTIANHIYGEELTIEGTIEGFMRLMRVEGGKLPFLG